MTATNPAGGAAIPVSVDTTRKVQGGAAIPVYGYMTAPTDGRPALGGAAVPVRVLTAADLKQNGGQWTLEGRPYAMPVYTAPAGATVQGGPAIAVYPVNVWPTVPVVPAFVPTDLTDLHWWAKADGVRWQDAARTTPAAADADPVGAWDDKSANAFHVTQATAGNRPVLKLNIQNGLPVLRFTQASNQYLARAAGSILLSPASTVYVAFLLTASQDHQYQTLVSSSAYTIRMGKNGSNPDTYECMGGGGRNTPVTSFSGWHVATWVFNNASSAFYINGQQGDTFTLTGVVEAGLTVGTGAGSIGGDMGELVISGAADDQATINQVTKYLLDRWQYRSNLIATVGDSKTGTFSTQTYQDTLLANLQTATGSPWHEVYPRWATGGYTVANMSDYVNTNIGNLYASNVGSVLCNLGVNEMGAMPDQTTWQNNYLNIIDKLRTKFVSANFYIMRPWKRGFGAQANTIAGWIANVVNARSSFCYLGPDERVFLENGDDGVTFTSDGTHPNAAGYALTAAQWQTVMGY